MSLKKVNAKYIIINSGYSERLVCTFKFVQYDIKDNTLIRVHDTHLCDENCCRIYERDDPSEDDPLPLFLYDSTLFASPNLDLTKYTVDILKIVQCAKDNGNFRGIFVYENNTPNHCVLSLTKDYGYCQWYEVCHSDVYYDDNQLFTIVYNIDSESG